MESPSLDDRLVARDKPTSSPVMFQRWDELLFLHWEIDPEVIQKRIPDGLSVDLHEEKTYLGLVPFFMRKIRPRFLPCVPWLSNFLELNVRAYVHDSEGRPGVWFFSLDCDQPIAVEIARRAFHLPYQHAEMSADDDLYRCRRKNQETTAIYDYSPAGDVKTAEPGSLEFFLLERYLLFSENKKGELRRGQVHHTPYPYSEAQVDQLSLAPFEWEGFEISGPPVSALMSRGVDVSIHGLEKV